MKKVIILALALVAGASLYPAEAAKKKDKIQAATPVVVPVQLATSSDSVSYAAGMNATNGLLPYLIQQQGVDTAYIADFIRGFQEVAQAGADPKMKAYAAGLGIATQVRDRMLPDIVKEFTDSPDSIIANLFFRGFTDALQKDTTVFTQSVADAFFSKKQRADKAAKEKKTDLTAKVPVDKKVKIGKLANGLTYYIRANKKPENRVVRCLTLPRSMATNRWSSVPIR